MAAKAVMKTTDETGSASSGGTNSKAAAQPDYKLIPRKDLHPSPTNPRKRFPQDKLDELAASFRLKLLDEQQNEYEQGILEPLIVRRQTDQHRSKARKKGESAAPQFEIVCGERRWRAAKIAGLEEIPCLVRNLTDEQVLDTQIHENLHREDVHPMDEAYSYQFLKEKLNCDVTELALRVGKSEGYVLNRLKLNSLIKEAQKDIDDNHLPLSYALEIAKYTPEIQKFIYGEVYRKEGKYKGNEYVQFPVKGQTVPWKSFIEWINTNIHRLLSKAPFDTKATNLRSDGLACVKCPERTGAIVSLFEPNQIGKKDACLNPACYVSKAKSHVQIRRQELAELGKVELSEVPIVRSFSYANGKDYLGSESAIVVSGAKRGGSFKNCKNAVSGIDIETDNYGQTVQVCLKSSKCKVHWPDSKASSKGNSGTGGSAEVEAAERLEAHRARREEIWNAKVAEAVRIRVLRQAAERFEKKFSITDVGTDFLAQLVARFWRMTSSGDSNNLNAVVKNLLAEWEGKSWKGDAIYINDGRSGIELLKKLKRGMMFRILFLMIHAHKGTIGYSNSYSSQKEVRELASEFEVDYELTDAEVRLEFSGKKHKQAHETHLESVRGGKKDAKVPYLYSEKWNAKD